MSRPAGRGAARSAAATLAVVVPLCLPATAGGAEVPLWEFGLGAGAVVFDDYRGADTAHVYPVPVPYFIYRGKILKSDRDGMRGLLFGDRLVELSVSVNATTPVSSQGSDARAGMPNLRPTIEVGPALQVHLWRAADQRARIDLRLPVRRAITIESAPRAIGWLAGPNVNVDFRDLGGYVGWDAGILAGPLFADRAYHGYFYTVAPQYATAARPAYQASGGYSGTATIAAVSKRWPHCWLGAFVRYDTLAGAAFLPSPVVRHSSYWAGGVGFAWLIGKSARMVTAEDTQ